MYRTAITLRSLLTTIKPAGLINSFPMSQIRMKYHLPQSSFSSIKNHSAIRIPSGMPSIFKIKNNEAWINTLALVDFSPYEEPDNKHYAFNLYETLAIACAKFEQFKRYYPIEDFTKNSLIDIDFAVNVLNLNIFEEKTDLALSLQEEAKPLLAEIKAFLETEVQPEIPQEHHSFCTALIKKIQTMIDRCHANAHPQSEEFSPK